MPKATAVWLIENTTLSFQQIAEFCGLHPLEVQGIADGEVATGIVGLDPISTGILTKQEIEAAEADKTRSLRIVKVDVPQPVARAKGPRYTPVAKRQDRPNAIAWLLRYHPELTDGQISKLVGTTKSTINSIRERTHWNISNVKLEDPVSLGMCTQTELDMAVTRAKNRKRNKDERDAKAADAKAEARAAAEAEQAAAPQAAQSETPEEAPATDAPRESAG
jgi:hypothetical protein